MNRSSAYCWVRLPGLFVLLGLWGLVLGGGETLQANDPLAAPLGVVVLRNGHVLHGRVARLGDRYLVALGDSGEIGLPAEDVQFVCRDMEHAFRSKLAAVESGNVRQHLELAHWCLRHDLLSHSAAEIRVVSQLDPMNPHIASLQRRLVAAAQAPTNAPATVAVPPPRPKQDAAEQVMDQLTPDLVEQFTHRIQPLLLNQCSSAACHGPATRSGFQLTRSPFGSTMTRPLTQRNLLAVVRQIDRDNLESSPLLKTITAAHGTAKGPIFADHQQPQYDELAAWVRTLVNPDPVPQPATIPVMQPPLAQAARGTQYPPTSGNWGAYPVSPAAAFGPVESAGEMGKPPGADQANATPTAGEVPGAVEAAQEPARIGEPITTSPIRYGAPSKVFQPRDPFDPAIFNRRYFPSESADAPGR